MDVVRIGVISQLEVILAKVEEAYRTGGLEVLNDAHELLTQLHSSVAAEQDCPRRQLVLNFRSCTQDLDRAELMYSSGFEPAELSVALELSMRRVYQLLRLARLPLEVKREIRSARISERQLRPLLTQLESAATTDIIKKRT